ncbi:Kelch repeat-containing protein [Pyxidicoccus sp. 3LFB2]
MSFQVSAKDPQGSPLRFSWSSSVGTLTVSSMPEGSSSSQARWTAPECLDVGVTASFTVTVTNAVDLSDSIQFLAVGIPDCPKWTSTGHLATGRWAHTATLLSLDQVLVTGGGRTGEVFASAEVYNPAKGTWSTTGSLATVRSLHTATLLPSGKVLVVGGYNDVYLSSAEAFDPATGDWSPAGNLEAGSSYHTATLLHSGRVLVTGGYNRASGGAELARTEVYDPMTETWTRTGSLAMARRNHAATLLPSGKLLVTGGISGPDVVASAEVYDPETGTWTATGSLNMARRNHTATLLPSGKVLVTGGNAGDASLATAELYDPATGTWSSTGSLATSRWNHTATLLPSGKVLVTGGAMTIGVSTHALVTAELYAPATGTWSSTVGLGSARVFHTATLLSSGKVLATGGYQLDAGAATELISSEVYDPG